MCFKLTVLGSAAALPDSGQISTALVLQFKNSYFLFDCAEGTQIKLRQNKIPFSRIGHIFISHLHGDHYFGLFGLLTSFNLLGRRKTLNIYAPAELKEQLRVVLADDQPSFPLHFHALEQDSETIIQNKKSFYIKSFPLHHRIPSWGFMFVEKERKLNIRKEMISRYRLQRHEILRIKNGQDFTDSNGRIVANSELTLPPYKTRSFAVCTDTAAHKAIPKYVKQADLLYHEATFAASDKDLAEKTLHSTSKDAAKTARLAGANQLLLGHISNRYPNKDTILKEAQAIFPNSITAEAGESYSLPAERHANHPSRNQTN